MSRCFGLLLVFTALLGTPGQYLVTVESRSSHNEVPCCEEGDQFPGARIERVGDFVFHEPVGGIENPKRQDRRQQDGQPAEEESSEVKFHGRHNSITAPQSNRPRLETRGRDCLKLVRLSGLSLNHGDEWLKSCSRMTL